MLPELLRRDWVLNRRAVVALSAIFAAFLVFFVQVPSDLPPIWLFLTCLWAAFIAIVPIARDHTFRAVAWSCTLPVSRADLVRARYAAAWVLVAGVVAAALALAVLVPGSKVSVAFVFDLDTLLAAAGFVTFLLALALPFLIRFGILGLAVFLVPINILLPVVFVVSKVTGNQDNVEGAVLGWIGAIADAVAGLRDGLSRPVFYVAVLLLLVFTNWASYRLALALFRRREL